MAEFGFSISSEEFGPQAMVDIARQAERSGFEFVMVSDHFHPWVSAQGESPFIWSVIGGIAAATERIGLGTAVTCPIIRTHPAIIAHAAATSAAMMSGRFFLGVGTGENLNEHILGDPWPEIDVRLDMLAEAIDVMRTLWEGGYKSYYGQFYTVENARLYTLPDEPPPIVVAAAGQKAAELAAQVGDGVMSTSPSADVIDAFNSNGNGARPKYIQIKVCYGEDEAKARKLAHELWPTTAMPGQLGQETATPFLFESIAELVTEDMVAEKVVCGPDVERHAENIQQALDAGFDHIAIAQIGPEQEQAMTFYQEKVLPRFQ
ncbi:MAG TPA: TIGR03557 family F420-dependent LLM class oxidoreductase [Thermomicrobiales bacterium]|nr:TIGR03557 family F420-dependent LLM class oxidoreductase [Thermomicrobiales bacterium]